MGANMLTKIGMVLGVALVLGTGSQALAKGAGGVMRCSLDGVNTARHGNIFGKRHPDVAREYGFVKLSDGPGKHGTWAVDPGSCGSHVSSADDRG
jgi:hypothetical protein